MTPRPALAGRLRLGRHGQMEGAAGVMLRERAGLAVAAIALRDGRKAALQEALRAGFGLAVPRSRACTAAGGIELVWTGPNQWLALDGGRAGHSAFGFAPDLAAALGEAAPVTDLTGARAILSLSGPRLRDALCKLLPVDLEECVFPPGAAAVTLAGHIGVTLWRAPDAGDAWCLACLRSYGASLVEAVLEAAAEFGCAVEG
ncbi:sarcosine oxidase subunit gamma [Falsiroseomonas bella]|nr:sarcosine oxidase subunit gamma family protein [Falsiroseomonas bella]